MDLGITVAWLIAKLMRTSPKKKLPSLKSLLRRKDEARRAPQTPEEQRDIWLEVAAALGIKVERHETPVI